MTGWVETILGLLYSENSKKHKIQLAENLVMVNDDIKSFISFTFITKSPGGTSPSCPPNLSVRECQTVDLPSSSV